MIDCSNLGFTYDGERFALRDANVHVAPGEFVCILGGNGSGKSTFAKHINALLLPDEGTMEVDGRATTDEDNVYLIRSTAGMVFQNPDDQLVASLVEDDVAFGPENLGVATPEIAARVEAALKEVGLVGFEKHETHALSGGQKQRVAIAGVLAMEPAILILDEASSMLDPRGRKGLMRVCRELHERGMTIVMITHFMEEAAEADRVIVMEAGHVALSGTPDEVLVRTDVLSRLNLEVPFACDLSLRLQAAGMRVPTCVAEAALVDAVAAEVNAATAETADANEEDGEGPSAGSSSPRNAESIIVFDDVSYTYDAAFAKKKKKLAKKGKAAAPAKQAAWGNSPDAAWAVSHVSFDVRKGEFLGIAGHTGSGKSTIIQHMNAILHASEGRVLVGGEDVADKAAAARARSFVGVVFQYPEHQLFAATVYDDVAFGPRNMGLSEDEVDARVRESLERVGLDFDAIKDASPFELSGGQQRRVAFAGVLAMRPRVLVLDEPVAGLDPNARREFLGMVSDLHKQGLTVVMVSHSMDDLAALCNRIAVFKEGELFAIGEPREVFLQAAELNAIGLGLPAAQRMANALCDAGLPLAANRLYDVDTLTNAVAALAGKQAGTSSEGGAR